MTESNTRKDQDDATGALPFAAPCKKLEVNAPMMDQAWMAGSSAGAITKPQLRRDPGRGQLPFGVPLAHLQKLRGTARINFRIRFPRPDDRNGLL